jgi:hypothetical protein
VLKNSRNFGLIFNMASEQMMKDPLRVGKAIRSQLEHEIPKDSSVLLDFREGTDRTITDECV